MQAAEQQQQQHIYPVRKIITRLANETKNKVTVTFMLLLVGEIFIFFSQRAASPAFDASTATPTTPP